jgi:phosphoglycolate phosphatase
MKTFDGIIFDIDGTIWDTTEVVAQAWNVAIDKNFPQVPHVTANDLKKQFGKTMDEIAQNLFHCLSKENQAVLIEECCIAEQDFLHKSDRNLTYNGIIEVIQRLAQKYSIYIVSNCQSGYIPVVLEKNNLDAYIKDSECFGGTGLGKAENIDLIIKRNNLKNSVYIGDTLGDFLACKDVGVPFVWAKYGFGHVDENQCYASIGTPSDLLSIL